MSNEVESEKPDFERHPLRAMMYVLSTSTRQRLMIKIALGATTVRELANELDLAQSTVRDNLKALEAVSLVVRTPGGAPISYRLGDTAAACATADEVAIRVDSPLGTGMFELTQPLAWLNERD